MFTLNISWQFLICELLKMSEEHRELAMNIKNIHKDLRSLSALIGYEEAWKHHMKDEETRQLYAKSMKQLAEKHWKNNSSSEGEINLKLF